MLFDYSNILEMHSKCIDYKLILVVNYFCNRFDSIERFHNKICNL